MLRRILGGEEIGQYVTSRQKKDGTIIEVSLTASPIVDPAGATVGVATVSRRFQSCTTPGTGSRSAWIRND